MRKKIAIVAGGNSGEFDISIKSGNMVYQNIDKNIFEPYLIIIKNKDWYCKINDGDIPIDKNDFSIQNNKQKITFDCVFIAIHGTPGEDGKLQGYFDMLQIPYTSCDLHTSSITFNKKTCNTILHQHGINIAQSVVIRRKQAIEETDIITVTGLPCFVKPNNGGSSVATSKVKTKEALKPAITEALTEDAEAIIESFISGTEITCGLMKIAGEIKIFSITEIVPKTEFFDYKAKYSPGFSEEITPARIDNKVTILCHETSRQIYEILNCKGFVRMDYIWTGNKLFFLEVNTVPGMTEVSIIPQQAAHIGISKTQLITFAINEALNVK